MTNPWYKIVSLLAMWVLTTLFALNSAGASVEYGDRPMVVTDHQAFALLPAELIAAPTVIDVTPSPDLRYLLVVREERRMTPAVIEALGGTTALPPPSATALVLWDSQNHQSQEVWRLSAEEGTISRMEWMSQSATALVIIRKETPAVVARIRAAAAETPPPLIQDAVLRVDASSGKGEILTVSQPHTEGSLYLRMNPAQPLAVLESDNSIPGAGDREEISQTFMGLRPIGPPGAPAVLPPGTLAELEWAEDGSAVLSATTRLPNQLEATATATYTLDLGSGKLRNRGPLPKVVARPAPVSPASPPTAADLVNRLPVTLETTRGHVTDGSGSPSVEMLWLRSTGVKPGSRALVALDATDPRILPDCQGIVYIMKGAVWVTPAVRMNLEQYGVARLDAQKKIAANHARQLGTAIICWAQDYDEKYPTPDGLKAKLLPYVQDWSIFDGFVYTYPGGNLADIAEPAETVLGYVTGPGGQATLYADGHVKWQND